MLGNLLWKIFGNRYGAVALGVAALAIGFFGMSGPEVTCGSQRMSPGDTCHHYSKSSSYDNSYEEEKSSGNRVRIITIGVGWVLLLGGAAAIVVRATRRRQGAQAAPADTPSASA